MTQELFDTNNRRPPSPKQAAAQSALLSKEQEQRLLDVASRLKVLEERYSNSMRREQLAEENALTFEKDLRSEIRALKQRMNETKKHASEIIEHLETLQEQVKNAAQKYDLRVVESYLNMIQPMQFMTRTEAKALLKEYKEEQEGESDE